MKERRDAAQATEVTGNAPPPILYLDCRGKDVASPQGFASAIRELVVEDAQAIDWWKIARDVVSAFKVKGGPGEWPKAEVELAKLFAQAPDKTPMASIIDSLTIFLEASRSLPMKPVFIIDEANKLMRWHDDPDHEQLRDLLDFLVQATKQNHLGHFVLASSESFVINFLENGKLWK